MQQVIPHRIGMVTLSPALKYTAGMPKHFSAMGIYCNKKHLNMADNANVVCWGSVRWCLRAGLEGGVGGSLYVVLATKLTIRDQRADSSLREQKHKPPAVGNAGEGLVLLE